MKKLLILLAALGSVTVANANDIPDGNYEGTVRIDKPSMYARDCGGIGNSTTNGIVMNVSGLPIGGSGVITANINLQNQNDCFGGNGIIKILGQNYPITAVNCKLDNNRVTGYFTTKVTLITFNGSFDFTKAQ